MSLMRSRRKSKNPAQLPMPMHHSHDLHLVDRPIIRIGMSFIENQIRAFHQHPSRRRNLRTTCAQSRMSDEQFRSLLNLRVSALRSRRIVQPDRDVDIQQIFPRLRRPEQCQVHAAWLTAFSSRRRASSRVFAISNGTASPTAFPTRQSSRNRSKSSPRGTSPTASLGVEYSPVSTTVFAAECEFPVNAALLF